MTAEARGSPNIERAIATYKTVKGIAELGLAAILLALLVLDEPLLPALATILERHVYRPWSAEVAALLTRSMTPRGLELAALALLLDGLLTSTEGWALRRGRTWGQWLVVVAMGSLLPFDVLAWTRGRSWVELVGLVCNLVVVVYLARRALRRARAPLSS